MKKLKPLLFPFAALITLYTFIIRPWLQRWGANDEEVNSPLPGDDLALKARMNSTRAINIHASAADIWPWLVQIGYQRAGWYSYDKLEALAGVADFAEGSSARRILPQFQNLKIGDKVPAAPEPYVSFTVKELEPQKALVLFSRLNPITGISLPQEKSTRGLVMDGSWAFILKPLGPEQTRLIIRFRAAYSPIWIFEPFARLIFEPVIFIMEQKMLRGIKERAESRLN